MATVCGASLALMDAGVPLKAPVAGIAMGLIKEGNDFAVLSDILGDEDHLGDMDFKVAGTENGVTALQMDIKITGITEEIMRVALDQAHAGRLHILGEMAKALTGARAELGEHAPRIETIKIPTDKIREVIGSGGSVIREIVARVRRQDRHRGRRHGQDRLRQPRVDREGAGAHPRHHVGARGRHDLQGQGRQDHGVRRLRELLRRQGRPGAHLAADATAARETVGEVVKEGQEVCVKLLGFDDRGKTRLSMKIIDQATGKEIPRAEGEPEEQFSGERPPRRDGGGGRDRPRRRGIEEQARPGGGACPRPI